MSDFEKERNNFEKIFGNKLQYETLLGLYCCYDTARTWNGWYKCAKMKDAEITRLRAEIERKDEILRKIKIESDRIQNIDYGLDGDCGAKNHAEYIEDLSEQALQNKEEIDENI